MAVGTDPHEALQNEIAHLRQRIADLEQQCSRTAQFRTLILALADPVLVICHEIIQFANAAAEALFKRPIEALTGSELGLPLAVQGTAEVDIVCRDGKRLIAEMRVTEVVWDGVDACLISLRDITRHKRLEANLEQRVQERTEELAQTNRALRQSEERFRTVADFTYDWEYWIAPDGTMIYVSPSCQCITGYCPTDFQADASLLERIVHPDDRAQFAHHLHDEVNSKHAYTFEYRIITRDGKERWIGHACQPVYSSSGVWLGQRASNRDITEHKQAEEARHESQMLLQAVMENAPIVMVAKDLQGRYILVNHQAATNLHLEPEQMVGKSEYDLFPASFVDLFLESDQQVLKTGQPVEVENTALLDDELHTYLSIKFPIYNTQGEVYAVGAIATDITERKRMEQALRESEEVFRRLFDESPVGVAMVGLDFHILRVNDALCHILGYPRDELLACTFPEITHPDDVMCDIEQAQQLAAGVIEQYEMDKRYICKDGHIVWASISVRLVRDANGQPLYYLPVVQNISERKRIEQALHENQSRLQAIFDNAAVGINLVDRNERYIDCNQHWADMVGLTIEDIRRISPFDITHPDDKAENRALLQQLLHGEIESCQMEKRYIRSDTSIFWGNLSITTIPNEQGELETFLGIVVDITERKRAEAEIKRAWYAAEAAAHTKAEFLANMSHEIRTPMNAVIGMTSLLLDTQLTAEQREYVHTICTSGDALLTLVNDILDFSKMEAGKLHLEAHPFNLRDCVEDTLEMLAPNAAQKQITLAYFINEQIECNLIGDRSRLRQILVNLVSNGIKFTEHGEVVVSVEHAACCMQNAEYAEQCSTLHAPCSIHLSVRDTGIGIPAERMNALFQSFSQVDGSTTRKYGGTGLGLTISKRLAEMMGGTIWVESEVGKGSTFHVTITAQAAPPDVVQSRNVHVSDPETTYAVLQNKWVLIVDDSTTNRSILTHHLQQWGVLPILAVSANEALNLVTQGEPFDAAIVDMRLPDRDGLTLAQEIHACKQPGSQPLPIILWTSLDLHGEMRDQARMMTAAILSKPIRPALLYDTLVSIFTGQPVQTPTATPLPATAQIDPQMARRIPLRILLAEDNIINQKVALGMLGKLGYRADVAANGIEVLYALEHQCYDLVLMDVQMPEMDGVEATRFIRLHWSEAEQPRIVAMTARALEGDREWLMSAGMDDYISKPVRLEEFAAVLAATAHTAQLPGSDVAPLRYAATPQPLNRVEENDTATELLPTIDIAVLDECLQTIQSYAEEESDEFLASFLDSALMSLVSMRHAVEHSDARELARAAHSLRSCSAQVGALALSAHCATLEMMGEQATLDDADNLMNAARSEYTRVRQALDAYLTGTDEA